MPVFSTPSLHHRAPERTSARRPGGKEQSRGNTLRRGTDGTTRGEVPGCRQTQGQASGPPAGRLGKLSLGVPTC